VIAMATNAAVNMPGRATRAALARIDFCMIVIS
jgi:hypothetical protein